MNDKNQTNQLDRDYLRFENGPSYAESVKMVKSFYNFVEPSMVKEEDRIRSELSGKFQMPVEIIDECLCSAEYLDDSTLNALTETKTDKRFFELAQKVKRNLVKIYRHDELADEEITAKISKAVL